MFSKWFRFELRTLLMAICVVAVIASLNVIGRGHAAFTTAITDSTGITTRYRVSIVEKGWPLTHLKVQTFNELAPSNSELSESKLPSAAGNHWLEDKMFFNFLCWALCMGIIPMLRYAITRMKRIDHGLLKPAAPSNYSA